MRSLLEKNDNMTNYYYFNGLLGEEEIDNIRNIAKRYDEIRGNVSGIVDDSYRRSNIRWIPDDETTVGLYDRFIGLMRTANRDMWGFHISGMEDDLQYTEYDGEYKGFYDWHMDFGGHSSSTRKISMVVQLSDPGEYEGGELQFWVNRGVIDAPRERGTVIFFPSYLTHRVNPVVKGHRETLVCWFHGPAFV